MPAKDETSPLLQRNAPEPSLTAHHHLASPTVPPFPASRSPTSSSSGSSSLTVRPAPLVPPPMSELGLGARVLEEGRPEGQERKPQGLPQVSRECLISEIKCYGKHILPVFIVNFVLLGLGLAWYFSVISRSRRHDAADRPGAS